MALLGIGLVAAACSNRPERALVEAPAAEVRVADDETVVAVSPPPSATSAPPTADTATADGVEQPVASTVNAPPDEETLEHYDSMVDCLADRGFEARLNPMDGSLDIDSTPEQSDRLLEVIDECRALDGKPPLGELTEEMMRTAYPYLVELHACLESVPLPVPELITEDAFVEGEGRWHPLSLMWAEADAQEVGTTPNLRRAMAECPVES